MTNYSRFLALVTFAAALCALVLAVPIEKTDHKSIDEFSVRKQESKVDVVPDPEKDILDRLARKIKELRSLKIVDVTAGIRAEASKSDKKTEKDKAEKKPVAVPVVHSTSTDEEEFTDKAVVAEQKKEANEAEKKAKVESGEFSLKVVSRLAFEPEGSSESFLTDEEREGLRSYIRHKKIQARRSSLMLIPSIRMAPPPPMDFLTEEENEGYYKYMETKRMRSAIFGVMRMARVDSDLDSKKTGKKKNSTPAGLDLETAEKLANEF